MDITSWQEKFVQAQPIRVIESQCKLGRVPNVDGMRSAFIGLIRALSMRRPQIPPQTPEPTGEYLESIEKPLHHARGQRATWGARQFLDVWVVEQHARLDQRMSELATLGLRDVGGAQVELAHLGQHVSDADRITDPFDRKENLGSTLGTQSITPRKI